MCNVVHCKRAKYDVYIGRPSKWGNPFVIGKDGSRADVVRKYEEYLLKNDALLESLYELHGKIVACWCAPAACHGDVLVKYAAIVAGRKELKASEIRLLLKEEV